MRINLLCALLVFLTLGTARAQDLTGLMAQCAPDVHPTTMGAIVRVESGGNVFILSDDGPKNLPWSTRKTMLRSFRPESLKEASQIARDLIEQGHLVGIGLTQVSSRNLPQLGLSVEQLLDPCTNLRAGGQILTNFYLRAVKQYKDPQSALLAAISAFNTGSFDAGFTNGYVNRVVGTSGMTVPALRYAGATVGGTAKVRNSGATRRSAGLLQAKFSELDVEFR